MADALKIVQSSETRAQTSPDRNQLAEGLVDSLADTYRLIIKTHAIHWNVEGPLFFSIHSLTEEHYRNMLEAADNMAERLRALRKLAPHRLSDVANRACVRDQRGKLSVVDMCAALAQDHQRTSVRLNNLAEAAREKDDTVTEALAKERRDFHQQAEWMLRALTKA